MLGIEMAENSLQTVVRSALDTAYDQFQEFAEQGTHQQYTDTHADFASKADTALTSTFRAYFDGLDDAYHILSEEQLDTGMQADPDADYTVIIDEFDGTYNMMNGLGEDSFGPCIAIADETNPTFNDVQAAGFLDVPSSNMYVASKGGGAFIAYGDNVVIPEDERGTANPLKTTGRTGIDSESPPTVIVDDYMLSELPDEIGVLHATGPSGDYRTWAGHMAKVARGGITPDGYDLAVTGDYTKWAENKHSTAEELASGYLLVTEAGGAITDWDGNDIGEEEIGLQDVKAFNVIVAATPELAQDVAGVLPDVAPYQVHGEE